MKKSISLLLFVFLLVACATTKQQTCSNVYQNNYSSVSYTKFKNTNGESDYYEVSFNCVASSFYSRKVLFDNFGIWGRSYFVGDNIHPILIWENVNLFEDGKKYFIYAGGTEKYQYTNTTFMVFDENYKDMLAEKTPERAKIIQFLGDLIKKNNPENKKFQEKYNKLFNREIAL
ncbi:hypothetical protein [Mesonia sp. K7]|uniref:hypothetical protein n=1 Tax=Mesonia sp. K7 TaxID=2218606 RepID=UPI000DA71966|nr:hypothetical protein [Mesonia sp. K7]PZD77855.1 hypothetical protein DNG35_07085 [Mesonia sp. K7]